jgi:hypothetical protein
MDFSVGTTFTSVFATRVQEIIPIFTGNLKTKIVSCTIRGDRKRLRWQGTGLAFLVYKWLGMLQMELECQSGCGMRVRKFPVFFPVSREFLAETGSLVTASTASPTVLFRIGP